MNQAQINKRRTMSDTNSILRPESCYINTNRSFDVHSDHTRPLLHIRTESELRKTFEETAPKKPSKFSETLSSSFCPGSGQDSKCANSEYNFKSFAQNALPILTWLPSYDVKKNFVRDLVVGVTLGFVIAPKALAHALLANVESITGLYTVFFSTLVYGTLGNIKWLSVGTAALPAMLFGESIGLHAERGPMLTLWIGVFTVVILLLRLDRFLSFVPAPVFSAVTTTAAFLIGTSQVKHIFGLDIKSTDFIGIWADVFSNIADTNLMTLLIGCLGILFLFASKHVANKYLRKHSIPDFGAALLVLITTLLTWGLELDVHYKVKVVGEVEAGMPSPQLPWEGISSELHVELMEDGAILAVVNFLLTMAIAKTFAEKSKSVLNVTQELRALTSVNVVGSFFGTIVAGGSFSGSAIIANLEAGTLMHNFINSLVIMLLLVVMTPMIRPLPKATLAAIIIAAVPKLINFHEPKRLWKTKTTDFLIYFVTFVVTMVFGVRIGLLAGVGFAILVLVRYTTRNTMTELGQLPGTSIYRSLSRFPNAMIIPGVKMFRVDVSINFVNAEKIRDRLEKMLEQSVEKDEEIHTVILSCEAVNEIDTTGIDILEAFGTYCAKHNYRLYCSGWKAMVRETLYSCKQFIKTEEEKAEEKHKRNTVMSDASDSSCSTPEGDAEIQDLEKDGDMAQSIPEVINNSILDPSRWYLNIHDAILHTRQIHSLNGLSQKQLREASCVELSSGGAVRNWNYKQQTDQEDMRQNDDTNDASKLTIV